ncbi:DoxX family protein [Prosthecobacter sp.]|uniref:DoxX family protein n=1 Tax=Prosthecobacter sp. TaxID=1965333 RepID=UPI0024873C60|nr:DoxX family protein [Prosthecobacter sp.]MDI1311815.1 DoxX family protein [Prosthecobacter sp.]
MDPSLILLITLKVIVGLGILNVWLLRSGKSTAYRGGAAKTLRAEFATYGLPSWSFVVIGVLKVALALALLASIQYPSASQPAAIGLGLLMLGAFVMHLKVKDPMSKALPSLAVLAMCTAIVLL